jgi:hypothetical protein
MKRDLNSGTRAVIDRAFNETLRLYLFRSAKPTVRTVSVTAVELVPVVRLVRVVPVVHLRPVVLSHSLASCKP